MEIANNSIEQEEEVRQLKSVIIHFATLDKMPFLHLLDRGKIISHVVEIARNKLEQFPPKGISVINEQKKVTSFKGCPFNYCDRTPICENKCRYSKS